MVDFINKDKQDKTTAMPLLPLRDVVVFPHMIVPLFVGRERSIFALESAMKFEKSIFLVAQKNAKKDEPHEEDIYNVGTIGTIIQLLRLPDRTVKVLVEGRVRGVIKEYDGLVIRSATKVTQAIIDSAENLKVIGRAGSVSTMLTLSQPASGGSSS